MKMTKVENRIRGTKWLAATELMRASVREGTILGDDERAVFAAIRALYGAAPRCTLKFTWGWPYRAADGKYRLQ